MGEDGKVRKRIYIVGRSCKEPKGSEDTFNRKNLRINITMGSYMMEETDDKEGCKLIYQSVVRNKSFF